MNRRYLDMDICAQIEVRFSEINKLILNLDLCKRGVSWMPIFV